MAKDILKEAIADAKAVREVALANAKAALEEAFTPKLQSMLSAKLSETLNEEEEDLEEDYGAPKRGYATPTGNEPGGQRTRPGMGGSGYNPEEGVEEDLEEITGMENEGDFGEGADLDEEINLEEILNELELEEGEDSKEETVDEAKDKDLDEAKDVEETMDEAKEEDLEEAKDDKEKDLEEDMKPNYKADYVKDSSTSADKVHEDKDFNLDALLEEINNLDEGEDDVEEGYATPTGNEPQGQRTRPGMGGGPKKFYAPEEGVEEGWFTSGKYAADTTTSDNLRKYTPGGEKALSTWEEFQAKAKELGVHPDMYADTSQWKNFWHPGANDPRLAGRRREEGMYETLEKELEETKAALEVKTTELNEVNLLNSKLLYVNRIFKANNLDDAQKLRVVETLDKADCIKEAKLIYETIKDTFNVAKSKKASVKSKTKSLSEGLGMASKAAGTSTAPKKEVIAESDNMVNRFQKLANIKINQ